MKSPRRLRAAGIFVENGGKYMLGTIINVAAILAGSALGVALHGGMSQRFRDTIMQGLALCVLLIGVLGAIETANTMIVIFSVVLGGLVGEGINIEKRLDTIGEAAQRLFTRGNGGSSTFARGFVTASLVYCVGAMAIMGSLNSGLRGDHATLIAKSILDGVSAVVFASTLGPGVALSALAVFLYQGAITLLAQFLAPLLTAELVTEMSAVGGLLIVGIGVNLFEKLHVKVGNLLPAIFMPVIVVPFVNWLTSVV